MFSQHELPKREGSQHFTFHVILPQNRIVLASSTILLEVSCFVSMRFARPSRTGVPTQLSELLSSIPYPANGSLDNSQMHARELFVL